MKAFLKVMAAASLAAATSSCSSFLDINTNPNSFTSASAPTPNAILAQALVATANNYATSYNSYASFAADYWGKSGVVNGYAAERTYNYSSSYYQGLWSATYDNLNDYNVIQTQGVATNYPYHAAIARIMKAYNYLLLVDQYGDIPYTNALKGLDNLTPTYDKAQDIYKDLIVQLNGAITDINAATASSTVPIAVGTEDVVFAGNMTNWKRFANSLKLRILLRESQTADAALNTYVQQQMATLQTATDGFITTDVQVQPGYAQNDGQQNPLFNRYGVTIAGAAATERSYQMPTNYIIRNYTNNNTGVYDATLSDPRITVLYGTGRRPGLTGTVYVGTDAGEAAPPIFASTGTLIGSRFAIGGVTVTTAGILKGYNAPTPLMLLSEHLFNKAEAETRGLITNGDAKADFQNGILASFMYFFRPATTAAAAIPAVPATSTIAGVSQYNTYMALPSSVRNPNVNFDIAPTNGSLGKQYTILYQKYLAMNSVASTEAWDDFRRAAQPKIEISLQAAQAKFPTRLFYPLSEVNTNGANVPKGVDQYTKIFWDVVD
jgi:hypothetical protein